MSEGGAERIETIVDAVAAAVIAAAAACCALRLSSSLGVAAVAAILALCCGVVLLRAVRPEERHFLIGDFAPAESPALGDKLVVGDEDSFPEAALDGSPELLLDDVLAELAPDSRVVRLFDRTAMPTPGELRDWIDRHLGSDRMSAAPHDAPGVDASQALHEALAELRRSLR
jgi:hypothetical protein